MLDLCEQGNDLKIESDPAVIQKTLDEIEKIREEEEVRSIASSIATSHTSEPCSTLPPLEPHTNMPRPTTPDVIAMVSSIQEECAPSDHPPLPPLHNPAANPPPLYPHSLLPQMPQISAARDLPVATSTTPPTMKRCNK